MVPSSTAPVRNDWHRAVARSIFDAIHAAFGNGRFRHYPSRLKANSRPANASPETVPMARSALLNVMVAAATKAGRSLTRDFGEVAQLQVSVKGPGDFVSAADTRAEDICLEMLTKARPGYSFLMEERGAVKGDPDHRWIIDPLDGTTNFLHSIPLFCVSMALEVRGELRAGVIYNPIMEELFTVERGQGAFMNDRRIRVAGRKRMAECVIAGGVPTLSKRDHGAALVQQRHVMGEVAGYRTTGASAISLAWTAAGRFDGYYETGLQPWDIAAGLLLLREAGGFASEPDPKASMYETGRIVAGNEHVHRQLREIIQRPIPKG